MQLTDAGSAKFSMHGRVDGRSRHSAARQSVAAGEARRCARLARAEWRGVEAGGGERTVLQHEGTALVFEGLDDLAARIDDPSLPVTPETVLVLRAPGPIGAGMPEAGSIPIPAKLARAGVKDMVRIPTPG
jgi:hypothetical protein